MKHHRVLRIVSKLLIPFIMLFALYVQFHGDFGPGGGFQAGVILASAFILYGLIFGLENARKVAPPQWSRRRVSPEEMCWRACLRALRAGNSISTGKLAANASFHCQ